MAKGSMSHIMSDGNRIGKFGIQSQIACNGIAYRGDMVYVFNTGTDMIIVGSKEHLRLMFQSPVGGTVQYAGIVPGKITADVVGSPID